MSNVQESSDTWLAKKDLDECSLQFRTVWDMYLKFYIVFLTVNGAALGLTVEKVETRVATVVIASAFIAHNLLAAGTALFISKYSIDISRRSREIALFATGGKALPDVLLESPLPSRVAWWGGLANFLGHVVFVALWLATIFIRFRS